MPEMLLHPAEREFAKRYARFLFHNPLHKQEGAQLLDDLLKFQCGIESDAEQLAPVRGCERPWVDIVIRRAEALLTILRERVRHGEVPQSNEDVRAYEDLAMGALFFRTFEGRVPLREAGDGTGRVTSYPEFVALTEKWTNVFIALAGFLRQPDHMFAIFFQHQRSLDLINRLLQGNSRPMMRLRSAIWNSIFPHEMRLYGSLLFDRMHDVTTLILGASGTGKELVATAIGLSRFVPFDAKRLRFTEPFDKAFYPINLSAMPGELIESEMFGHCAGAFTGANKDRTGWFERCALGHTVFLDEIGELAESVQVKLLRVLQSREFYRVGETESRRFDGRIIAATNRDLGGEIGSGRFRHDLFYRLCSDIVHTPSLREQLDDCADDLPFLVCLVARKCLGERSSPEDCDWLTTLTTDWIHRSPQLGAAYAWPGNFRELEQCVRSVMVRGEYHPLAFSTQFRREVDGQPAATRMVSGALQSFVQRVRAGDLTYDELLTNYCSLIYSRSQNLTAAARKLDKHRATVQSKIDTELVENFQRSEPRSDR